MEIRQLKYFKAVADEKSFSKAAKLLHIAQPPLSQQIKKFENELGVILFKRTKHNVELTPAGTVLLEEANAILAKIEDSVDLTKRAHAGLYGKINLGLEAFTTNEKVFSHIRKFKESYPHIKLAINETTTEDILNSVQNKQFDIGILVNPDNEGDFSDLTFIRFFREEFVVVLPAGHKLLKQKTINIDKLKEEKFIFFSKDIGCGLYDKIMGMCYDHDFTPNIVQQANHVSSIIGLVASGIGISILPDSCSSLQIDGIEIRKLRPKTNIEFSFVLKKDIDSELANNFIEIKA